MYLGFTLATLSKGSSAQSCLSKNQRETHLTNSIKVDQQRNNKIQKLKKFWLELGYGLKDKFGENIDRKASIVNTSHLALLSDHFMELLWNNIQVAFVVF